MIINKILNAVIVITFILAYGLIFLGSFWILYPYKTLDIKSPMEVVSPNKTIVAGEELYYRAEFTKYSKAPVHITRTLVDGIVHTLPETEPRNTMGIHNQVLFVSFPKFLPAGTYYMKTEACYQVNPIREICVEYRTEEFTVIK